MRKGRGREEGKGKGLEDKEHECGRKGKGRDGKVLE